MGEAKRKRDKEHEDYLKSLNNHIFKNIRIELEPKVDSFGLIPNTWYQMLTGDRKLAYYKGVGQITIGFGQTLRGLHQSNAFFSTTNMRSSNCVPANIKRNVLPKLIRCAESFGYIPGKLIMCVTSNSVVTIIEDSFFVYNNELHCKIERMGGGIFSIPLFKDNRWNIKEYRPI